MDLNASYLETIANGTYVEHCPAQGRATVNVTDTKVFFPKTGGRVELVYGAGAALLLLSGVMFTVLRITKRKSRGN